MIPIFFYLFALIAVITGLMVITSRNSVKAVLSLVVTFLATAGIWLLLYAEFLAFALIVVYVGAVMVLFLFVVMMLDVEVAAQGKRWVRYWPLVGCVPVLLVILLAYTLTHHIVLPEAKPLNPGSNVVILGQALFTDYLYPFIVAGLILLAAMIAAIVLTFRGHRPDSKTQDIPTQVQASKASRLKIIKDTIL